MKWIAPLGFLGLLGIVILILIYILKPNYQQKFVSSTFVWKLSLKYKKKKIPIQRLRNLIILLCQILIITVSTFILAQPFLKEVVSAHKTEKILIMDASASMLAIQDDGHTRFESAVSKAKALGQKTILEQGMVTVIMAGKKAAYITVQTDSLDILNKALDSLECTYGQADINGAIALTESILAESTNAEVILYTATQYSESDTVKVENVSDKEWNAAILDCNVDVDENFYVFSVDVASYYNDMDLTVYLVVDAYDDDMKPITVRAERTVSCLDNETVVVLFNSLQIHSFSNAYVEIKVNDSFWYDNNFYIYGGIKEAIKVLYASPMRNSFLGGALLGLRDTLKSRWNIEIEEVKLEDDPELSGYDFYIFEHEMPNILSLDGVILLVNPGNIGDPADNGSTGIAPQKSGLVLGETIDGLIGEDDDGTALHAGELGAFSQIMYNINPDRIKVSQYTRILSYDGYMPLMFCNNSEDPVFLVKDEADIKIAVLSFSLNYSNLPMLLDFPGLMLNLFNYFIPSTINKYVYDVDEQIKLNARGQILDISDPMGATESIKIFPHLIAPPRPGIYSLVQQTMSGTEVAENFYVRIVRSESEFNRIEEFEQPYIPKPEFIDLDLLLYFASALFALVFLEMLLHVRRAEF